MKETETHYDVGVIVGRFQIYKLHEAHKQLIETVLKNHSKMLIFLGLSPCKTTFNNPLDFQARKQMILEEFPHDKFPNLNILYIKDEVSDQVWSKKLDSHISDLIGPNQSVVLYGGRDSFIPHYSGKYKVLELESDTHISSTVLRDVTSKTTRPSEDFRAGVIWCVGNQYQSVHTTVDVAIIDHQSNRLLLGRKEGETLFRFIGGFADVNSDSYELDAKREVAEETGLAVDDLKYIGSTKINDWRYRSERNKIKTLFYCASYIFGGAKASDDIAEVKWFDLNTLKPEDLVINHRVLLKMLGEFLNKK